MINQVKIYTTASDIRCALSGRGFMAAVINMVLVIGLSSLDSIIEAVRSTTPLMSGYHAQLIITALSSNWVTLAIPILCVLPFTTAFVDDIKSG